MVSAKDLVITDAGVVAAIVAFWQSAGDETLYAEANAYECLNNDARFRSLERSHRVFIDTRTIIEALIWYEESPTIIKVSLPPALLYA